MFTQKSTVSTQASFKINGQAISNHFLDNIFENHSFDIKFTQGKALVNELKLVGFDNTFDNANHQAFESQIQVPAHIKLSQKSVVAFSQNSLKSSYHCPFIAEFRANQVAVDAALASKTVPSTAEDHQVNGVQA